MYSGSYTRAFQRSLLCLHFQDRCKDGGGMSLRNFGNSLPDHMLLYPRRWQPLARSSTGTVFVRVNGRPSMADQVVRYWTSSTAAELHPTQCRQQSGAYSTTRVHKLSLHVTVVILLIWHTPQWHILMCEAYIRIRTTDPIWMGSVRHSAEYVVCSRRVAMPLHIMGSVGRIRPYTGDDLLGRIWFQWTTSLNLVLLTV
jgi:hypothetical protein